MLNLKAAKSFLTNSDLRMGLAVIQVASVCFLGCQLVSSNSHKSPEYSESDNGRILIEKLIEQEILPSLSGARDALVVLDMIRSTSVTDSSLSNAVYELEKAFRSTGLPEASDQERQINSDTLEIHLPFLVGRKSQLLVAKVSKNRSPQSFFYDRFGIKTNIGIPPVITKYLLERQYDPESGVPVSYWFFNVPALRVFWQASRDNNQRSQDDDLSLQFVTRGDVMETTVSAPNFKRDETTLPWKMFQTSVTRGSSDGTRVKLQVLCKEKEKMLEFTIKKSEIAESMNQLLKKSINSQLESGCFLK